jgi:hypothetical protein
MAVFLFGSGFIIKSLLTTNTKLFISILLLMMLLVSGCSNATKMANPAYSTLQNTNPEVTGLATYTDPFSYCAAIGQIDAPDARYIGPKMTEDFFKDYLKAAGLDVTENYPDTFKQMTIWRCMGGLVYACNFGANIPCDSKADTSKTPSQAMIDYCKQSPDNTYIPMSVTGHSVIYSWYCNNDTPEINGQLDTVDPAGYQASFWQLVNPTP